LAEIQAQKEPPTVESVDVGALLEDAACGLQTRPGVDVEVVCEPGLRARTNPDLAAQALASVAANAAKYTIRGRIVLRAAAGEGGVTIAVADTGPGINAETQRRMVERFYRGDARAGDGFGLGLSIAAQAVDSLGGSLDFASSTEGTTVKICLPEPS
jgi:signal transduction histidine kinase